MGRITNTPKYYKFRTIKMFKIDVSLFLVKMTHLLHSAPNVHKIVLAFVLTLGAYSMQHTRFFSKKLSFLIIPQ